MNTFKSYNKLLNLHTRSNSGPDYTPGFMFLLMHTMTTVCHPCAGCLASFQFPNDRMLVKQKLPLLFVEAI